MERTWPRSSWLGPVALVFLVMAVYWQVRHFGFVNFDDPLYVTDNPKVLGGLSWSGLGWAFGTGTGGNWHPLTWLSHMADVTLFGRNAGAHHLVSAGIHAANTVLLFWLLEGMTAEARPSFLVACLFAIHPLHVESVAWVSERKDVLSTFFGMLALLAYVRHGKQPGGPWLKVSFGAFLLSLMSKSMLVTLPVLMLLLDAWPLRRGGTVTPWADRIREKWPFFLAAGCMAAITVVAQRAGGSLSSLQAHPLPVRLANAGLAGVGYLRMMVWPSGLAAFHPFPPLGGLAVKGALALSALGAVTATAFRARVARPYLWMGWAWFLITLLPVIGLVQVGIQAMADRYTYLPLVGPFCMAAWAGEEVARTRPRVMMAASTAVVAVLSCLAWAQASTWRSSVALFRHAVDSGNDGALVRKNLGLGYLLEGDAENAVREYGRALAMSPGDAQAYAGLGKAQWSAGRREEALASFREAHRLRPGGEALYRLGRALAALGRREEALARFQEFLGLAGVDPASGMVEDAHMIAGLLLAGLHRPQEARGHFEAVLLADPGNRTARVNFGLADGAALERAGRWPEAWEAYRGVLAADPGNAEARSGLERLGNVAVGGSTLDGKP
ncbi:tetratricopeptide repeat protein [Geothrix sp. 21YS21S-2]|uniref:tetratricopeptide repeat protein n=1 Tax=Geothrix sp. 21YS21S-2 TaxID=3068893 RepID=UPI0027BAAA6E|nr:tetratricopeptide repeat protein [Geothrix sp. 21YS21S-2]